MSEEREERKAGTRKEGNGGEKKRKKGSVRKPR